MSAVHPTYYRTRMTWLTMSRSVSTSRLVRMRRLVLATCRSRRLPATQVNLINELDESQTLQKDLYNMELERINYMLRNYMRDRLRKVSARPALRTRPAGGRRRPPALAHAKGRRAGGAGSYSLPSP